MPGVILNSSYFNNETGKIKLNSPDSRIKNKLKHVLDKGPTSSGNTYKFGNFEIDSPYLLKADLLNAEMDTLPSAYHELGHKFGYINQDIKLLDAKKLGKNKKFVPLKYGNMYKEADASRFAGRLLGSSNKPQVKKFERWHGDGFYDNNVFNDFNNFNSPFNTAGIKLQDLQKIREANAASLETHLMNSN